MNKYQVIKEIVDKSEEELLSLIRGASTGSNIQETESKRELYVATLNYKLSKITDKLSRRILFLNVALVFLTIILILFPILKKYDFW